MASFLVLSRPLEHRRVHFSLGDSGWVRLQPSSSERATFASPFCLESDRRTKTHSDVNAKAFTERPSAHTKAEVCGIKSVFSVMKFNCLRFCKEYFDHGVLTVYVTNHGSAVRQS